MKRNKNRKRPNFKELKCGEYDTRTINVDSLLRRLQDISVNISSTTASSSNFIHPWDLTYSTSL